MDYRIKDINSTAHIASNEKKEIYNYPSHNLIKSTALTLPMVDGRESVEHQLEIHLSDLLVLIPADGKVPGFPVTVEEVLAGLRYTMDYRIDGGRQRHLSMTLCSKLADALLTLCSEHSGTLFTKHLTRESHIAFILFVDFLREVSEFDQFVSEKTASDLKYSLFLDERILDLPTIEGVKESAIACIFHLSSKFPQFASNWKDLVRVHYQKEVEMEFNRFKNALDTVPAPLHGRKPSIVFLYPPQSLHFDRAPATILDMFRHVILPTKTIRGLSTDMIPTLHNYYGYHTIPRAPPPSISKLILHQLSDLMVIILIASAILNIIVDTHDYITPIVLFAVVIFNICIGFTMEFKATRVIHALLELCIPQAKVTRDGIQSIISSEYLVPGDLVHLEEGDAVPADLRLIEAYNLHIDESILTGESVPVQKDPAPIRVKSRRLPIQDCKGNAFMGTMVSRGSGKGIVVRIGKYTELGKISNSLTGGASESTHLQKKLKKLTIILVIVAFVLCTIISLISALVRLDDATTITKTGISLAISVIPEGLVAVMSVTLALAVGRMAKKNAIVRKLPCVETLGSVTVLCSDKTGTLTQGMMRMISIWFPDINQLLNVKELSLNYQTNETIKHLPSKFYTMLVCGLCHHVTIKKEQSKETMQHSLSIEKSVSTTTSSIHIQKHQYQGDSTEIALVKASQEAHLDEETLNQRYGIRFTPIHEIPFDSDRKLMSRVFEIQSSSNTKISLSASLHNPLLSSKGIVLVKGACESLVPKCDYYLKDDTMKLERMDEHFMQVIVSQHSNMASCGLRVLALAYRMLPEDELSRLVDQVSKNHDESDDYESHLVFVGMVGLWDPPREGVRELVGKCHQAGIQVFMMTGDHYLTAETIANSIGILSSKTDDSMVIKGKELDILGIEDLAKLDPFPRVFARVTPEHKLNIVQACKLRGQIVAVTGDGVNDAPALKKADVGVAMGISGSEITKQAADIVLSDDQLSTLLSAISEGRRVFDNIIKFLVYLLSCNSAEILVVAFAVCIGVDNPMSSKNILFANIIADIPPSMSLGLEPPEKTILQRSPRNPKKPILTWEVIYTILINGILIASLSFFPYYYQITRYSITPELKNEAFGSLVILQLVLVFLCRTIDRPFWINPLGNKWIYYSVGISMICLICGIYIPGFNTNFVDMHPLSWNHWIGFIIRSIILILVNELLVKLIIRRFSHY